jgi:hypothetical protein
MDAIAIIITIDKKFSRSLALKIFRYSASMTSWDISNIDCLAYFPNSLDLFVFCDRGGNPYSKGMVFSKVGNAKLFSIQISCAIPARRGVQRLKYVV